MAGLGRRSLYRKSVTDDYLNGLPEPEEGQFVAKAGASRGGNVIEVLVPDSGSLAEARESSLAILPTKFRKLIWIKRGDFLIVSGATADCENAKGEAGKIKYRVEHVLSKDQVKHLRDRGLMPDLFGDSIEDATEDPPSTADGGNDGQGEGGEDEDHGSSSGEDSMDGDFVNPNLMAKMRMQVDYSTEEEDGDSDEGSGS